MLCSKTYCCYGNKSDNFKFSSKGFKKRVLEDSAAKHRRVLDEAINLPSTCREFRTLNHMVATYEQTKKNLVIFIRKDKFKIMDFIKKTNEFTKTDAM